MLFVFPKPQTDMGLVLAPHKHIWHTIGFEEPSYIILTPSFGSNGVWPFPGKLIGFYFYTEPQVTRLVRYTLCYCADAMDLHHLQFSTSVGGLDYTPPMVGQKNRWPGEAGRSPFLCPENAEGDLG